MADALHLEQATRDMRAVCTALGFGLLFACSSESSTKEGGATDVVQDASVLDAQHEDAAERRDAEILDVHADASDAEITDVGQSPFAHCPEIEISPAFVTLRTASHAVAQCDGVRLHLLPTADGVTRLVYTATAAVPPGRSWAVSSTIAPATLWLTKNQDRARACTDRFAIDIEQETCRITVSDANGNVLLDDPVGGGHRRETATSNGIPVDTLLVERQTPTEERFYGLGEKTGSFDRRGRSLVFFNTDAYDNAHGGFPPGADPLYLSIPFFIGLRDTTAYGLFTDNPHRLEMDLAATNPTTYQVRAFGGVIDQYLIPGPTIPAVVRRYTSLTGRPPRPPRWSLGYHQCRWGYSPASRVQEIRDGFRTRSIPADGLWLDIQHMDGFRTFTWDPVAFPDPAGLVSDLAATGFKVTVIADPGIKVDPGWSVYDSGLAGDHFLKEPNGDVYVGQVWPGASSFPDFSRAATRTWWGDQVGSLVGVGVRGIWLDVNEPTNFPESGGGNTIPDDVIAAGDGHPTTMAEIHNVYALNEARATYEGMLRAASDKRPFILSRAGYAGIQRYAAIWTGDAPSTWWSLQDVLPMLLNLSLSGVPFIGSDVGGYSGGATPELFARWMAVGSFSPFFRGHVTNGVNDQEPWEFGPEVEVVSRSLIQERYRLLPYLYSLFDASVRTGAPPLTPLVYTYQSDPVVQTLSDQALLGPFLLFAPLLAEAATEREIYLPAGRWFERSSGAIYDGPVRITRAATPAALPTFVRAGAILPLGPVQQHDGPLDPLTLDCYPDTTPSTFPFYDDDGDGFGAHRRVIYSLEQTSKRARLSASIPEGTYAPNRNLRVRLRRVDHLPTAVTLDGSPLVQRSSRSELEQNGGWFWDARDLAAWVQFADRAPFTLQLFYDPTLVDPRPPVDVHFHVVLPSNTPSGDTVHVAVSANGWTHHPLTTSANSASGTVSVPRGDWFLYKFTRGDWGTVEKWPGCLEADDRYAIGAAIDLTDEVFTWRDQCE